MTLPLAKISSTYNALGVVEGIVWGETSDNQCSLTTNEWLLLWSIDQWCKLLCVPDMHPSSHNVVNILMPLFVHTLVCFNQWRIPPLHYWAPATDHIWSLVIAILLWIYFLAVHQTSGETALIRPSLHRVKQGPLIARVMLDCLHRQLPVLGVLTRKQGALFTNRNGWHLIRSVSSHFKQQGNGEGMMGLRGGAL